jgi:DNA-binding response OmpR family regulator
MRRMRERILAAGADALRNNQLSMGLGKEGYVVDTATTFSQGLRCLFDHPPHMAIIDVSYATSSWDGWEVCRHFREASELPIILLTASGERGDKLKGLGLGADDCLARPFSMEELVARVKALLRRTKSLAAERRMVFYIDEEMWVDFHHREVRLAGKPVKLSGKEFEVLAFLVHHPDQILSYEQLGQLWGAKDREAQTALVRQYIWRLRQKLEVDPRYPKRIVTERGLGYRFVRRCPEPVEGKSRREQGR